MTVIIKYPFQSKKRNKEFFKRKDQELTKEEVIVQCGVCESQGEVNEDEIDNIIVDSDGVHRVH